MITTTAYILADRDPQAICIPGDRSIDSDGGGSEYDEVGLCMVIVTGRRY